MRAVHIFGDITWNESNAVRNLQRAREYRSGLARILGSRHPIILDIDEFIESVKDELNNDKEQVNTH